MSSFMSLFTWSYDAAWLRPFRRSGSKSNPTFGISLPCVRWMYSWPEGPWTLYSGQDLSTTSHLPVFLAGFFSSRLSVSSFMKRRRRDSPESGMDSKDAEAAGAAHRGVLPGPFIPTLLHTILFARLAALTFTISDGSFEHLYYLPRFVST